MKLRACLALPLALPLAGGRPAVASALPAAPPPVCAASVDAAWAQAWAAAMARAAAGGRRPIAHTSPDPRALGSSACPGWIVGAHAPELAPQGRPRLEVSLPQAGYLAGAALGAALAARPGPPPSVAVAPAPAPTRAALALLAGLAAGLRATAPPATLLALGKALPAQAVVRLAPERPQALVVWRIGAETGRCLADPQAVVPRLPPRPRGVLRFGAADGALVCRLSSPTGAAALEAARHALAGGLEPSSLPDYTAPPLAVPPWRRRGGGERGDG
jgi:hypothetical protein